MSIGRGTYGTPEVFDWNDGASYYIGNYTSIANKVQILLGGEHHTDSVSTFPFFELNLKNEKTSPNRFTKGDVHIGSDVWIGQGAVILSGVTVGDGAVVGANSLVCKDVAPFAIVGGNPIELIRYRFNPHQIDALLRIKWWDWELDKIIQNSHLLSSNNIDVFINKFLNQPI